MATEKPKPCPFCGSAGSLGSCTDAPSRYWQGCGFTGMIFAAGTILLHRSTMKASEPTIREEC